MLVALFAHIIINWFGQLVRVLMVSSVQLQSTILPTMLAYLTTLVSTLNFVMFCRGFFYPHFRRYFNLYNEEGSLSDIQ